nr:hypothetical protein Iba_chr12dCG6520 [Ipomoea batatas]
MGRKTQPDEEEKKLARINSTTVPPVVYLCLLSQPAVGVSSATLLPPLPIATPAPSPSVTPSHDAPASRRGFVTNLDRVDGWQFREGLDVEGDLPLELFPISPLDFSFVVDPRLATSISGLSTRASN